MTKIFGVTIFTLFEKSIHSALVKQVFNNLSKRMQPQKTVTWVRGIEIGS